VEVWWLLSPAEELATLQENSEMRLKKELCQENPINSLTVFNPR
jgi:transcriptional regulatory protein LevR